MLIRSHDGQTFQKIEMLSGDSLWFSCDILIGQNALKGWPNTWCRSGYQVITTSWCSSCQYFILCSMFVPEKGETQLHSWIPSCCTQVFYHLGTWLHVDQLIQYCAYCEISATAYVFVQLDIMTLWQLRSCFYTLEKVQSVGFRVLHAKCAWAGILVYYYQPTPAPLHRKVQMPSRCASYYPHNLRRKCFMTMSHLIGN